MPKISHRSAPRTWTLATCLLVIAIALPILAVTGFGIRALAQTETLAQLAQSVLLEYTLNTLALAVLAGGVALGLGLPGAWFVSAYRFRGHALM